MAARGPAAVLTGAGRLLQFRVRLRLVSRFADHWHGRRGGAPDVHHQFGISGDGNYGAFDADQWTMSLNEHYFGATGMDTDQLQRDYREALLTVYHEARHAEQAFLMARERAGLGATADQIIQAMSQNPNSAPVPARWVVELAVQNPITQCDHTQYLTEQWYQSMYGSGADDRATTALASVTTSRGTDGCAAGAISLLPDRYRLNRAVAWTSNMSACPVSAQFTWPEAG